MHEAPIVQPGKNCWRAAHADRVSVLGDTAIYFEALADVFEGAQDSILILGWDIHSQVRLRRRSDDERRLIDLLRDVARARPHLTIRILIWDPDVIYAPEREKFQTWRFRLQTPSNVQLVFDTSAPTAASQHQKVVVVDDQIGFVGGIDITQRRWDTGDHHPNDPLRKTPYGLSYAPFHDLQAAVDGHAAQALSELARWRWQLATGEEIDPLEVECDHWPGWLQSDFEDLEVALSRTLPSWLASPEVREVEQLFFDSFAAAHDLIYLESQYLSSSKIAAALAERLRQERGPEVVIAVPEQASGWVEQSAMDSLRASVIGRLRDTDEHDRLRVVYPVVDEDGERASIYVHAKACAIDDRLLRIGSANLTNRSTGVDSELDLAIEASDAHTREALVRVRNRLVGNMLGLSWQQVARRLEETGSLVELVDRAREGRRQLVPIDVSEVPEMAQAWADEHLYDPASPLDAARLAEELLPEEAERSRRTYVRIGLLLAFLLLMALLWHTTPLSQWADPRMLAGAVEPLADLWWSVPLALAAFTVLSVMAFPTSVLILTMGFVFGAVWGSLYALVGCLLSATASFALGKTLGAGVVGKLAGKRVQQVHHWVSKRGVWSVVVLRMVPVAPFGVVNLAVGASAVRIRDFLWGTLIGMTPGIILKGIFGQQLADFLVSPSTFELAVLALILLVFVITGIAMARWVRKRGEGDDKPSSAQPLSAPEV